MCRKQPTGIKSAARLTHPLTCPRHGYMLRKVGVRCLGLLKRLAWVYLQHLEHCIQKVSETSNGMVKAAA